MGNIIEAIFYASTVLISGFALGFHIANRTKKGQPSKHVADLERQIKNLNFRIQHFQGTIFRQKVFINKLLTKGNSETDEYAERVINFLNKEAL